MIIPGILFVLGLLCLIKGGDWFVDGASALARRFHLPELKDSKLTLAGKTYNLKPNDNGNCLHGGGVEPITQCRAVMPISW